MLGFGAFHPRQNLFNYEQPFGMCRGQRTLQPTACFVSSFFHSSDGMHGMFVSAMTVQRGADAQEKFKGVAEIVSVVSIESIRAAVEGELRAESDIEAVAVR